MQALRVKHTKPAPPAARIGSASRGPSGRSRHGLSFLAGRCASGLARTHKQTKGKARMTHMSLCEGFLRSACKCVGTSLPLRKHLCGAIIRRARLAVAERGEATHRRCTPSLRCLHMATLPTRVAREHHKNWTGGGGRWYADRQRQRRSLTCNLTEDD